ELLAFLATADPIALREELVDETVGELAGELSLPEATLEALCEAEGIPLEELDLSVATSQEVHQ
ncbi:MAG: hypothetical protein ACPF9W_11540, partial [Nocardioides sp.]